MQTENDNDEEAVTDGIGSALKSKQGDKQEEDGTEDSNPVVVKENQTTSFRRVGYILAVMNVLLDTYGSLLTKLHGWNFTTWGINLIRFGCSGVLMALVSVSLTLYQRSSKNDNDEEQKKDAWFQLPSKTVRVWAQVCLGVVFVTFLCPALSNYALFQIPLAYALTLTSITPLYAAFFEWTFWGRSKRPTVRALLGSSMAIGGVVWLGILNAQANEG
jgi:drug/metabolite transporter (DMT)-like permease